jgi:hypothetical protein
MILHDANTFLCFYSSFLENETDRSHMILCDFDLAYGGILTA